MTTSTNGTSRFSRKSYSTITDSDFLNYLPSALANRDALNVGNVSLNYDTQCDGRFVVLVIYSLTLFFIDVYIITP